VANATAQLNEDLRKISYWAEKWLVEFNAGKSKALTVSLRNENNQHQPPITFNNTNLEPVERHKHLGIILNSSLTWKDQILEICEKANKKVMLWPN
jgi:hypothetical protein